MMQNEFIEEKGDEVDENGQLENLDIDNTRHPIADSGIEEANRLEVHREREKAEDMALMLACISREVSKKASTGLMQILKDDSFDKQLFNEMFKRS